MSDTYQAIANSSMGKALFGAINLPIPVILDEVTTLCGPGEIIDVIATERGLCINPRRVDLIEAALTEESGHISAMSFWEIAVLISKDRLEFKLSPGEWRRRTLDRGFSEIPVTMVRKLQKTCKTKFCFTKY